MKKIIISVTEEKEINRKTNRYAESIVQNIAQKLPNESVTVLNAFEIFNLELHRIFNQIVKLLSKEQTAVI